MTDCWHWTGGLSRDGYGYVSLEPTPYGYASPMHSHRYMYDILVGDIPYGYHIHHRCKVKDCWNPFHLEAVTPKEHYARHHTA